jgi:hypothetical protein
LANFLSIFPNQPCFCGLFAWSQLDFSAIPVSIYADFKVAKWAVSSLTHCPFQVNMFISRFMIQILLNIQNVQEETGHQKKRDTSSF